MSNVKVYESLTEIVEAKRSGALPKSFVMWIDNDCTGAHVSSGRSVYEGPGPEELLFEALEILGIKARPV